MDHPRAVPYFFGSDFPLRDVDIIHVRLALVVDHSNQLIEVKVEGIDGIPEKVPLPWWRPVPQGLDDTFTGVSMETLVALVLNEYAEPF